ncbi:MAG: hypothetical protein E7L36_00335 [Prevotella bivia]|nr:hypothetical protein [Prevotella bivia]
MMKDAASVILTEELEALKKKIIAQHFGAGQKASGRTAASLRVEVTEEEGTLYGRSPFGTLETGRKPGKVPQGFQAIIRKWMADKGINAEPIPYKTDRPHKYTPQERGNLSLSYLIARKIRREGTSLFRKGGRADIYSNVIPEATERIKGRIVELLKMDVENIKLNNIEV